ncbi:WxL domain-containing protein [Lactobacillus sp. CBA3605]|uniref:WxL domain-containing protein n=1 Tax=Lactobacillus sp. CBA3605 TaxID=2099788 RepID=UPI000CFB6BBF|nr:WxL domain-containing protein [Lactobacillus sp. CBA3605]AVK61174.1 WxL domain-containing protein [Lactobacillus sp. CBA3605]
MNKIAGSLVMTSALLVMATMPMMVQAATNTQGTTAVTTTFTKGTSPVSPVEPTNPNQPTTAGDASNGATGGAELALIYVTNSLGFGSHALDVLNNQAYKVDTTSSASALWDSKAVVEVADVRGTGAGWNLTVTGENLTSTTGAIVKGASVTLPTGAVTNSGNTVNGAVSVGSNVALAKAGSASQVLTAAKDNGTGVTVDQLSPSGLTLNVPANTVQAQTYATTLNWNLSDIPVS